MIVVVCQDAKAACFELKAKDTGFGLFESITHESRKDTMRHS